MFLFRGGLLDYEWFFGNDCCATDIFYCDFRSRDKGTVIKDVPDAGSLVGGDTITITILVVHDIIGCESSSSIAAFTLCGLGKS